MAEFRVETRDGTVLYVECMDPTYDEDDIKRSLNKGVREVERY